MNIRKLISLTAAVLITGTGLFAMVSSFNQHDASAQPATAQSTLMHNTQVVILPTINVTATPLPPLSKSTRRVTSASDTSMDHGAETFNGSALHKAALRLTLPQLRMPYYSFGSTTLQIGKD